MRIRLPGGLSLVVRTGAAAPGLSPFGPDGRPWGPLLPLPPGGLIIGRGAECHVRVDQPLVSRRHAQVMATPDGWAVRDLESMNGTWVNGERIGSGGGHVL